MTAPLGGLAGLKDLLGTALMIRDWEDLDRVGKSPHLAGRSESGMVSAELVGDPVTQVSLVIPVRPGAGTILGAFINELTHDYLARRWASQELDQWAADPTRPLDASTTSGSKALRLQSLANRLVVATVSVV